jgi:hypothetical protein
MFSGLEAVNPTAGRGLAVIALMTTLLVGMGNAPAPVVNIANALGYGGTAKATVYSTTGAGKATGTGSFGFN